MNTGKIQLLLGGRSTPAVESHGIPEEGGIGHWPPPVMGGAFTGPPPIYQKAAGGTACTGADTSVLCLGEVGGKRKFENYL